GTQLDAEGKQQAPAADQKWALQIIDADIHPIMRSFRDILPYLDEKTRRRIEPAMAPQAGDRVSFRMPRRAYFHPFSVSRGDTIDADGTNHAADPQRVKAELLDRHNISYAIVLGNDMTTLSGLPDQALAANIARAYNDWSIDTWLHADPRFRLTMAVAPQDPAQAAREIDRLGDYPGVVQVYVPQMDILLGKSHYWPIYEAAQRHGLPVAFHVGAESAGVNGPQIAIGSPTYYIELQTGVISIAINNVISLVCEGVFDQFPDLKVVFLEYGYAWVPGLMWRLDREWRSLRAEVPWLKRPPSEYIVEHMRFGLQPLEDGPRLEYLHQTLEMMSGERTLLFATDYPHWDFDDPTYVSQRLPKHMRQRIMADNARELYRL
ncbi:MAG: amidohydrolase, partial [Chloroflexi bacterium]|nr:amidohydrolase [Chloroflexota bacterium]